MHNAEFLLYLQEHRTTFGDAFFFFFTALGDTVAYLLVLPILYWTTDRGFFVRVLLLMVAVASLNTELKEFFQLPRPHVVEPRIISVFHKSEGGLGFPSGHAMSAACFWLYLAWKLQRTWFHLVAVVMVSLIGFSRLYLGNHWPEDVIGGIAIGGAMAILVLIVEEQLARLPPPARRSAAFVMVTGVSAALAFGSLRQGQPEGFSSAGVLLGLVVGWLGGARLLTSAALGRIAKLLCSVIGLGIVYLLYRATRKLADAHAAVAAVGFVSGLWIVWIAPALAALLPQPAAHPQTSGDHGDRHTEPHQSATG